jgi:hypothetical protein
MVTNPHLLDAFEREITRTNSLTLNQRFRILDGMYELARTFGHFSHDRVLEGIEHDIEMAKILNEYVQRDSH